MALPPCGTLLDFNGVLVDDEPLHYAAFADVMAPLGLVLSWEAYLDKYLAYDDPGAATAMLRDAGKTLRAEELHSLLEKKNAAYERRSAEGLVFFSGARAFVEQRAQAGPVIIVSGARETEIDQALTHLGVRNLITSIVSAGSTQACKPDPEGYVLGLARLQEALGPSTTGRVVAVEDSPGGVQAARAAGVAVAAVTNTVDEAALRAAGATLVADHLDALTASELAQLAGALS